MIAETLAATVAYAAPGIEELVAVTLPVNATVGQAVAKSGLVERLKLHDQELEVAIFGQRARLDTPLANGDRIELTRALLADPKDVRRARARRSG
ncbi:MAG: RnfH family protein [Betaproteobacteria bacterium]|nr:RnfH family protein [Betaproteobacteria bacterium]